jgi:hypothetical protein
MTLLWFHSQRHHECELNVVSKGILDRDIETKLTASRIMPITRQMLNQCRRVFSFGRKAHDNMRKMQMTSPIAEMESETLYHI